MSTATEYGIGLAPAIGNGIAPAAQPVPVGAARSNATEPLPLVQPFQTPAGPSVVVPPSIAAGFSPKPLATNPIAAFKSVIPYQTALTPPEEMAFQHWVATNKVPFDPSPSADYDMRGYWKAQQMGDPRAAQSSNQHFPDVWKTPYHDTFSNESIYATPLAPHWEGSKLVDWRGNVIADETPSTDARRGKMLTRHVAGSR